MDQTQLSSNNNNINNNSNNNIDDELFIHLLVIVVVVVFVVVTLLLVNETMHCYVYAHTYTEQRVLCLSLHVLSCVRHCHYLCLFDCLRTS